MHILFDIGGTKMRVAGSHDCNKFVGEPIVMDTPVDFGDGMTALKESIKEISSGENVEVIGGGIAGPFSEGICSLLGSPNLSGWIGHSICDELTGEFGAPVYIENDSAVVGLGEMHNGAGETDGIGAYITVSTGMGGARFIDGRIDNKVVGFEPGHQIIDADKTLIPEADGIFLQNLISGRATEKRMGMKPYDIKDDAFWDNYAKLLAYGLNNTIVHWSPDVVVLGGSMIVGDPAIPVDKTEEYLREILKIFPKLPEIKKAELGEFGGLYGAMVLVKQSIKNK